MLAGRVASEFAEAGIWTEADEWQGQGTDAEGSVETIPAEAEGPVLVDPGWQDHPELSGPLDELLQPVPEAPVETLERLEAPL